MTLRAWTNLFLSKKLLLRRSARGTPNPSVERTFLRHATYLKRCHVGHAKIRDHSPAAAPSSTAKTGAFGEHCLSSATSHVLCGLLGRVAQPPGLTSSTGYPEGARQGVPFSLVSFFWASKRKKLAAGQPPATLWTVTTLTPTLWRSN